MTSTSTFDVLDGHQFLSLTTFRKSGVAVPTPVWFAREGDRLYIFTNADSGKVKRIRNNSQVEIAPCDARGNLKGDKFPATARILPAAEHKHANTQLNKKYGIQKRLFDLFGLLRRNKAAYLEIAPG